MDQPGRNYWKLEVLAGGPFFSLKGYLVNLLNLWLAAGWWRPAGRPRAGAYVKELFFRRRPRGFHLRQGYSGQDGGQAAADPIWAGRPPDGTGHYVSGPEGLDYSDTLALN